MGWVVMMATVSVPPVIPKTLPRSDPAGPARRVRRPLPVPALGAPPNEAAPAVYALSAVDKSGRVADRSVVRALGWCSGTRLDIREHAGMITIRPASDGVHRIDDRGHLCLPLAARRWCHIASGDRLLVVADPATAVVVAYPLPVLGQLLAGNPAAAAGDGA